MVWIPKGLNITAADSGASFVVVYYRRCVFRKWKGWHWHVVNSVDVQFSNRSFFSWLLDFLKLYHSTIGLPVGLWGWFWSWNCLANFLVWPNSNSAPRSGFASRSAIAIWIPVTLSFHSAMAELEHERDRRVKNCPLRPLLSFSAIVASADLGELT